MNSALKLLLAALATAACISAQTNGTYNPPQPPPATAAPPPVSARPGSLNYVEGQVSFNGEPLTPQAVGRFALQPGQDLQTGNGHAEVLLTPGAFLRVGPNTDFRMTAIGLADTRINLLSGTAMIEADQIIQGTHVEVTIGPTSIDLLKKGLYSFAANPPAVRVFDGKADVITPNKRLDIGKHDEILLAGNPELKKTHFDENQAKKDDLYVWSEARSRAESEQNKLVAQDYSNYIPVGSGWFWDPYADYFGFWPAGPFYSPFGFGFYGGFYPGFYAGFYGGYHRGLWHGWRGGHGGMRYGGVHGNGVVGFRGGGYHGGFHGGGFHGGGGHR